MAEKEYKAGDKVRFISEGLHLRELDYYPPSGTVGTVLAYEADLGTIYVQWPAGLTYGDGCWLCGTDDVEPAED